VVGSTGILEAERAGHASLLPWNRCPAKQKYRIQGLTPEVPVKRHNPAPFRPDLIHNPHTIIDYLS
jgi:hypothetical protein